MLAFLEPRPAVPVAYMPHEVRAVTAARAAFFAAQSPAQAAAWRARFGARCAGVVAKVALEGGYFGEHCDDALQARRPTRVCVRILTRCREERKASALPLRRLGGDCGAGERMPACVHLPGKRAGRPSG